MWEVSHLVFDVHTSGWCSMIVYDWLTNDFIVIGVKCFVIIVWLADGTSHSILLRLPFIDEASLLNAKLEEFVSWQ